MAVIPSTTAPEGTPMPERHQLAPAIGSKIPSHFGHCFGCGELHPTGLHLVAYAGEGLDVSAQFTVTENHQGAPGLAHGGLLSLAFDEALGKLMWLLRAPAVTGRLETDFLKPVPVGSTLHITAEITGQSNRKVYTSAIGRLNAPDGEIAVKAFELSQNLRGKWLTADYSVKRRYLEIVFLNFVLDDVTLVPTTRKPFDVLAEGLLLENSRGDKI